MSSLQLSPRGIFRQSVSQQFLQDIIRVVFGGYREADEWCEERFAAPEAHDLRPYVRRAIIEQNIRQAASRHDGLTASAEPNVVGNCYHTEAVVGGEVIITVSAVDGPDSVPRWARFRQGYAGAYQMRLFPEEEAGPPKELLIYGQIIHGPNPDQSSVPGFIKVIFPGPIYPLMMCGPIDLLVEFRDLVEGLRSGAVEQVAPPSVSLRRGARRDTEWEA